MGSAKNGKEIEKLRRHFSQANVVASEHNFAELPSSLPPFRPRGIYVIITPAMIATEEARQDGEHAFHSSDPTLCPQGAPNELRERVIDELIDPRRSGQGCTLASDGAVAPLHRNTCHPAAFLGPGGNLQKGMLKDAPSSRSRGFPPVPGK